MFGELFDRLVGVFSPHALLRRLQARDVLRSYAAGEQNRLNANWLTKNQSADHELRRDADLARARARDLVRNNAYATGAVDTIVANVVGCGIKPQARILLADGEPDELTNDAIELAWSEWCEIADVTGRLHFYEMQALALREMVEAGECLIHMPAPVYFGEAVAPLRLELIEADRLASEVDVLRVVRRLGDGKPKIVRGVEMDAAGRPIAYWVYPEHPANSLSSLRPEPQRLDASNVIHLFRQDRIGQSRGISWLSPVVQWLRSLGFYLDNELQASAVNSCFSAAITSPYNGGGALPSTDGDATDSDGNTLEYLQPGIIMRLRPGESLTSVDPGRPNSSAEPWINLMLRAIAVGTGLSYETVARDYSKTTFSSNRASQLEDRRRFRRWQGQIVWQLCMPVYRRWLAMHAVMGKPAGMPTQSDLARQPQLFSAVEWETPGWEWVDPVKEQQASQAAIDNNQSTLAAECAAKGKDWRDVMEQRARELKYQQQLEEEYDVSFGGSAAVDAAAMQDEPQPTADEETDDEPAQGQAA